MENMMKKIIAILCCTLAIAAVAEPRENEAHVERDFGSDRFAAGGALLVRNPVLGDLIAAGGNLDVATTVAGDALLAGGDVAINKKVSQSLYSMSGKLFVNDSIGRNARVAGGQIEFSPISEVSGNVSAAGGQISLKGKINGNVQAAGGRVLIDAIIGGDVEATSGQVELGPNAKIAGKLRYAGRDPIVRDPAAKVAGNVETFEPSGGWPVPENMEHRMGRGGGWVWTIGLLLVAAVLTAIMPSFYVGVAETVRTRAAMSLLIGFVALICVPVLAILFLITIIGVPLGLLTIALYLMLLVVGYVSTGISIGDWLLARVKSDHSGATLWRIGGAVVGVLIVSLLARIPWIGGWVVLAALLVGLGALTLQVWQSRRQKANAA
jgi:cytoskeletal protein CcmA (bactofilin family)